VQECFQVGAVCKVWVYLHNVSNCHGLLHAQGVGFKEALFMSKPLHDLRFGGIELDVVDHLFA